MHADVQEQAAQAARLEAEAASHAAVVLSLQKLSLELQAAIAAETAAKSTALQQVRLTCC